MRSKLLAHHKLLLEHHFQPLPGLLHLHYPQGAHRDFPRMTQYGHPGVSDLEHALLVASGYCKFSLFCLSHWDLLS